jgi:preprotein translocase subunit YajC
MIKLKVGDKVKDSEGLIGIVKECEDLHNILVKYPKNKGQGIYCVKKSCASYDPLQVIK